MRIFSGALVERESVDVGSSAYEEHRKKFRDWVLLEDVETMEDMYRDVLSSKDQALQNLVEELEAAQKKVAELQSQADGDVAPTPTNFARPKLAEASPIPIPMSIARNPSFQEASPAGGEEEFALVRVLREGLLRARAEQRDTLVDQILTLVDDAGPADAEPDPAAEDLQLRDALFAMLGGLDNTGYTPSQYTPSQGAGATPGSLPRAVSLLRRHSMPLPRSPLGLAAAASPLHIPLPLSHVPLSPATRSAAPAGAVPASTSAPQGPSWLASMERAAAAAHAQAQPPNSLPPVHATPLKTGERGGEGTAARSNGKQKRSDAEDTAEDMDGQSCTSPTALPPDQKKRIVGSPMKYE